MIMVDHDIANNEQKKHTIHHHRQQQQQLHQRYANTRNAVIRYVAHVG